MRKMTRQEAEDLLYYMWECGEVPSNFTEDHSEYDVAVSHLMKYGEVIWDEIL